MIIKDMETIGPDNSLLAIDDDTNMLKSKFLALIFLKGIIHHSLITLVLCDEIISTLKRSFFLYCSNIFFLVLCTTKPPNLSYSVLLHKV